MVQAGTRVSGRIEGSEDVDVYGAVEGSVDLDGHLFVDGDARVDATLEVSDLTIHGVLVGNATVSGTIVLHPTARVVGDLVAPRIIMHDGALFRGLLDMGDAGGAAAPARRASPVRSAPAPRSTPRREPARATELSPEPVEAELSAEPEPPAAAPMKKVSVKKRKK